jgi:hypothetical protein
MPSEEVEGACLCGEVRFRVRLPSLFCGHCHCTMCQRNHGAGYVTWFSVPRGQLALTRGGDLLQRYASSSQGSRTFCTRCGSSLFYESTNEADDVDIPLANVDGPIDRVPECHIYFDDRAPWVAVDDGLPRFGGDMEPEPIVSADDDG